METNPKVTNRELVDKNFKTRTKNMKELNITSRTKKIQYLNWKSHCRALTDTIKEKPKALEDRNYPYKEQIGKKLKKKIKHNFSDLWNNIKRLIICITGIQKEGKTEENI